MDCLDKKQRTLGETLQMGKFSDEALAFVNGATANSSGTKAVDVAPEFPAATQNSHVTNKAATKSNGVPIEPRQDSHNPISGTVSMTFRLPSELSTRLFRASVERKLKRERPFSQQDIITEALANWLEKNS